jgi:hypothetical protein
MAKQGAKGKRGKKAVVPPQRLSCVIPGALYRRAGAYARWRGMRLGAVVTEALEARLSGEGFTVYTESEGGTEVDQPCEQPPPSPAPGMLLASPESDAGGVEAGEGGEALAAAS